MKIHRVGIFVSLIVIATLASAQERQSTKKISVNVRLRLQYSNVKKHRDPPAVMWLQPMHFLAVSPSLPQGHYTMVQKHREFVPHVLVVPVGSEVSFPNEDPFFHNVFSLFKGKRFDLGLYEAGVTRSVLFSRPGISYIFCNIHPEMSAVILALTTPYHAKADENGSFDIQNVPSGVYRLHIWIEGVPQSDLNKLTRQVRIANDETSVDLGKLTITTLPHLPASHLNMFGKPYPNQERTPY